MTTYTLTGVGFDFEETGIESITNNTTLRIFAGEGVSTLRYSITQIPNQPVPNVVTDVENFSIEDNGQLLGPSTIDQIVLVDISWFENGIPKAATIINFFVLQTDIDYFYTLEGDQFPSFTSTTEAETFFANLNISQSTPANFPPDTDIPFSNIQNPVISEDDVIVGGTQSNIINTGIGNDTITGSIADEQISSGGDIDFITGGLGADTIDGGGGDFDTVNYGQSLEGVTVNLDGAAGSGGEAEGDVVTNVEQVIGSIFSDVITGNNANNVFFGFGGDDQLFGGEGSDFLLGGAGADHLDGGNGILDTADYRASQAGVTVDLIAGTGLGGDAEGDTLVNIDQLLGSALGDNLTGNDENNILFGFSGDDTLSAGIGNDFLVSGLGADTLNGGLGSDTANYLSSTLAVAVDLANNVAIGGEADGDTLNSIENLIGTNLADTLLGSAENNLLFGFGGNDVFNFTAGVDTINGGADSDRVVFSGNQADFNFIDRSDLGAGVVFAADGTGLNVTALFDIEIVTFNDTGSLDLSTLV